MKPPSGKKKIVITRTRRPSIFNPPRSMSKAQWLIIPLALLLAYLVHLAILKYAGTRGIEKPVHVLLVTVDGLRADRLGCTGHDAADTGGIDALAGAGVLFTSAFAAAPGTLPSHAAVLTGRYPLSLGMAGPGRTPVSPDIQTLASALAHHGFATGAVAGSSALDARFGLSGGFGSYDDDMPQSRQDTGHRERTADEVTRAALTWLSDRPEGPLFLWLHYTDPLQPYRPPAEAAEAAPVGSYDGEIARVDRNLNDLLQYLFQQGLYDETLVILAGAYGQGLMTHGEETQGIFIYNDTVKVPLIFYHPGSLPEGLEVSENASLVDIAPTVLDMLGLSPAARFDGRSLTPLIRGQAGAPGRGILVETRYPQIEYGWSPLSGLVKGPWKFILAPEKELYDLSEDPGETVNLFESRPSDAAALETALRELRGRLRGREPAADSAGAAPVGGKDPKNVIALKARLDEARRRLSSGNAEAAESLFRDVLSADPSNPAALTGLGRALIESGRFEEAADHLAAARTLDPARGEALYHLAVAYESLGRSNEALVCLMEIGRLDIYYLRALNRIGRIHSGRGDMDEAIRVWREALAEDENQPALQSNLARALFVKGDLAAAEGAYRQVLAANPDAEEALLDLGKIYLLRGENDEAAGLFRKVLKMNPRSRTARELLKKTRRE
jgi:arylsulfatase A-like enzyme/Tfp pilus assembly protein PilF